MRTAKATFFLLLSWCPLTGQLPANAERSEDRNAIIRLIADVSRAYVARDPEPFERVFIENYVSIRGKPSFNAREQLIAMMRADSVVLKAGKKLDYDTISYESDPSEIRFYGNTAIVNVAKKNYWQYLGLKCLTRTQATELWIKRNSEWKSAGSHAATFQCEPKPFHPIHAAVAAIASRPRAPANADMQSELKIKELVNSIAFARNADDGTLLDLVERSTVADFVTTKIDGQIVRDRSVLELLPAIPSGRAVGLRSQDSAVLIYDDAAIYTFKMRTAATQMASEPGRYCSVFLARIDGKWQFTAAHVSGSSAD